ncbi:MAG: Rne/Rng family ribonuclease [Rhizomicrobium sp.]
MTKSILINVGAAEVRVAVVENGRLQQLCCTPVLEDGGRHGASRIGDIFLGRVTKLVPAIQAAFVDIGMDKAGFLGAREALALAQGREIAPEKGISGFMREGDTALVQIVKDIIGEKGARLTAAVTLPGRLLVLTPQQPGIAVSRRITDEAEHRRLEALGQRLLTQEPEALIQNAGFILRTSAYGSDFEALWEEAKALSAIWQALLQAITAARPPKLLYRDCGPVERALRDLVHEDTDHIIFDDAGAAESARAYCRQSMPTMEGRITLFSGPGALFDRDEIENDILALAHRRVALPSGGWIMLEGTEALTSVDVNSGHYTSGNSLENNSLNVNMEAAREIGRQVRLRGIGGVIVIDFIHLTEPDHMASVTEALEQSLTWDGSPAIVAPPSPFGLVEVTRKRVREPYEKRIAEPCRHCHGEAHLRRPAAIAQDVIRRIEAAAQAAPGATIVVTAAAEVIAWLDSQEAALRPALARKGAVTVQFTARTGDDREAFDVETVTR